MSVKTCSFSSSVRYCPDPPIPNAGGASNWNSALSGGNTTYGTTVEYTCQEGQLMEKTDVLGNKLLYEVFSTVCEWDQTWTGNPAMVTEKK
jgi:hypothetical protein